MTFDKKSVVEIGVNTVSISLHQKGPSISGVCSCEQQKMSLKINSISKLNFFSRLEWNPALESSDLMTIDDVKMTMDRSFYFYKARFQLFRSVNSCY